MTSRTRRFLFGSSLVLAVGLATGLVAYYNGNLVFGSDSSGPADLVYLPAETNGVAYADVRSIMASEFRQKLRQVMPDMGGEKDKLQQELGIDLERDIDSVLAGFLGIENHKGGIVLVRGRYNEISIEALALQHGAKLETYRGKKLLLHDEFPSTGSGVAIHGEAPNVHVEKTTGGIAFLEPGLLAIGDSAAIKKGIDAAADRKSVTANAEMVNYIADAQQLGNAWVVGRFDAITSQANLPEQVKQHMPGVQWFVAAARVNGGIGGTLRAEAIDDKSADDLRQIVNGGLAAARLFGGNDPKVEAMINSLQVTGTGRTVGVAFQITPEMIDTMIAIASGGPQPRSNAR